MGRQGLLRLLARGDVNQSPINMQKLGLLWFLDYFGERGDPNDPAVFVAQAQFTVAGRTGGET